jgi:putative RNA 2'-phosphotransferase
MGKTRTPQVLSKMLAYMLGRRPDEFGLIPDAEGFVKIKDLLKALHEEADWGYVNFSHLNEVLLSVPGAPFEIKENRIRCLRREIPGVEVEARKLPKLLYAAIRSRAYPHVHAEGIHPSSHPQVVLAADRGMAERLGRRIDPDPVILTVNVHSASEAGVVVAPSGEGLFLADYVPPGCFSGPPVPTDNPADPEKPTPEKSLRRPAMPGSFVLDVAKAGAAAHVPDSVKRRAEKNRGRGKHAVWTRETPPWKK